MAAQANLLAELRLMPQVHWTSIRACSLQVLAARPIPNTISAADTLPVGLA
jgi:hypothetical protein